MRTASCRIFQEAGERAPYLLEVPSKHKWISVKPFIGEVDLDRYLASGQIETVLAGGENYMGSRPLHYDWVKKVHDQCEAHGVRLIFGRRYNPGLVTSTFVNVPFGIYMVWYFLSNGLVSPTVNIISIIVGIVAQASMMVYGFAYLVPKMKREQAA